MIGFFKEITVTTYLFFKLSGQESVRDLYHVYLGVMFPLLETDKK